MAAGIDITLRGEGLDLATLTRIARDPRVRVVPDPAAMKRVEHCRALIDRIVERYRLAFEQRTDARQPLPHVYGVTTGFGEFKKVDIHPDDLDRLQHNILPSHAVGVGDSLDPDDPANYFPAEVVRAAIALRLNVFLKGHSGVRPALVHSVAAMLNEGIIPLVPLKGSLGSSGDLCPLAHLFCALIGEGRFYRVRDAADLRRIPRAFEDAATLAGPLRIRLAAKEGLALTNGPVFSAALLALCVHDALSLANTADIAAALTLEALCGRTRAFDPKVHASRGLRGQCDSAANILALLEGYDQRRTNRTDDVQDAYSLRCAPAVHGASRDALGFALMVAAREINSASDNPLFFPDDAPCDQPKGADPAHSVGPVGVGPVGVGPVSRPVADTRDYFAHSAGNFHGQPIGMAADFLAIALAEMGSISERRLQMLLDQHHNRNLPANLAPLGGLNSGFMLCQYTAASLVSENKALAHPASVDSIPTSANVEDHVAMATWAARKLRTVLANTQAVLSLELLASAQAVEWRMAMPANHDPDARAGRAGSSPDLDAARREAAEFRRLVENRSAEIASNLCPGTAAAYLKLREAAAPLFEDRRLDEDIRRLRELVADGGLVAAVNARLPQPLREVPECTP